MDAYDISYNKIIHHKKLFEIRLIFWIKNDISHNLCYTRFSQSDKLWLSPILAQILSTGMLEYNAQRSCTSITIALLEDGCTLSYERSVWLGG